MVAVAALAWFLLLSPRLSEADEITAQVEQVETSNLQLRNRVNQARDQVALAPAAAAEAQQLFATMPRAAELPTVLRQITDAAERAGIRPVDVSVISTSVPVAAGTAAAEGASGVSIANMDVGVTVAGPRESLLGFLDNLQALDRAFLITSTQVAADRSHVRRRYGVAAGSGHGCSSCSSAAARPGGPGRDAHRRS